MSSAAPDHLALKLPADAGSPKSPADFLGCPDAYYHLIRTLCLALPPPPSDRGRTLSPSAITPPSPASPPSFRPTPSRPISPRCSSPLRSSAKDCLRLAQLPETTPELAAKCRAQSLSMMREAKSTLRLLLKLQEARAKREADNTACDRAARTEHRAIALMTEALAAPPQQRKRRRQWRSRPRRIAIEACPCGACPGESRGHGARADVPGGKARRDGPRARPHRRRRALRRHLSRAGRVYPPHRKMPPGDVRYFDPPEATLAGALIAGRTPALAALDRDFATAGAA